MVAGEELLLLQHCPRFQYIITSFFSAGSCSRRRVVAGAVRGMVYQVKKLDTETAREKVR